jgi:hypothetical protein
MNNKIVKKYRQLARKHLGKNADPRQLKAHVQAFKKLDGKLPVKVLGNSRFQAVINAFNKTYVKNN